VLITNHALVHRAGTELYSFDLARTLRMRGHDVVVFSPKCGAFAEAIRTEGIAVVDRLDTDLAAPDVIHGHHHIPTVAALIRYPGTPAVFACHGAVPWEEAPPGHPRIMRYVAVDEPCRERLETAHLNRPIDVLPNCVDLSRFHRRPPLPAAARHALVFSNSADRSWTDPIAAACAARGIALDVIGIAAGRVSDRPEAILPAYDVVFAKARSALEAIAAGCAVIVCDRAGLGMMSTAGNWPALRRMNLGFRLLTRPHDAAALGAELDRYDPDDAARLTDLVRQDASLEATVDRWLTLYGEVRVAYAARPHYSPEAESVNVSQYLTWLGQSQATDARLWSLVQELAQARHAAEQQLSAVYATRTWRMRNALAAMPGVERLYSLMRGQRS